jgi:VWFA-related protein
MKASTIIRSTMLVMLSGVPLLAQDSASPGQSTVLSPAGAVSLWLTALDKKGRPVTDLTKDDLELSVGRVERPISRLTLSANEVLRWSILIDVSGSRESALPRAEQQFLPSFFQSVLGPNDLVDLTAFNDRIVSTSPTNNQTVLRRELEQIAALAMHGGSAVYDAVWSACNSRTGGLQHTTAKSVVVLISDGDDNASHHNSDEVADCLEAAQARLEFVGLRNAPKGGRQPETHANGIRKDAKTSGGVVYDVETDTDMNTAFESLAKILHAQYRLDFQPIAAPTGGKKPAIRIRCVKSGVKIVAPERY